MHRDCKPGACQFTGFDEDGEITVELPSGSEVTFPGCPVRHVDGDDLSMWLQCYRWLNKWGTTPVQMGLVSSVQLDPRYFAVMELIDEAMPQPRPREDKP